MCVDVWVFVCVDVNWRSVGGKQVSIFLFLNRTLPPGKCPRTDSGHLLPFLILFSGWQQQSRCLTSLSLACTCNWKTISSVKNSADNMQLKMLHSTSFLAIHLMKWVYNWWVVVNGVEMWRHNGNKNKNKIERNADEKEKQRHFHNTGIITWKKKKKKKKIQMKNFHT